MVLLLIAGTAFASNGETINIGGTVPLILNLTVDTSTTLSDNLPLVGAAGSHTEKLADITISTNNSDGWELWIFSVNGGTLDNSATATDSITYTLTYAGSSGVAAPGTQPTIAGIQYGEATTAATDTAQALSIIYPQAPDHPAGYYSDQLTVVLRAK